MEQHVIYRIIGGCSNNNQSGEIFQTIQSILSLSRPPPHAKKSQLCSITCRIQFALMAAGQIPAILSWVEEVARSVPNTPPSNNRFEKLLGHPSTRASQHKRKRSVFEADNPISQSDPSKRPHRTVSETASTVSVRLPDDIISLAPSSSAASRGGRSRSSSPSRVKAELAAATPRVVYIHESADPKSVAASQLLGTLTQDSDSGGNDDVARKVSNASCQCATELRSEGSWVNKVALPLLEGAIAELPLECWSVYVSRRPHVLLSLANF